MNLKQLDVLILTLNEGPNLERTLAGLSWAQRVVIIDSYSSDNTLAIAQRFANVEVVQRSFDSHAQQWNFGLDQLRSTWTLSLDADYVLDAENHHELSTLNVRDDSAFFARFDYWVYGAPLRASLLPPRPVLFRRERARFVDDGHTQRLEISGSCGTLKQAIAHDDRKSLSRWMASQVKYAELEALKLLALNVKQARLTDRLRLMPGVAPPLSFAYVVVLKCIWFSGWRGWFYALQRALAEIMILLALMDLKAQRGK